MLFYILFITQAALMLCACIVIHFCFGSSWQRHRHYCAWDYLLILLLFIYWFILNSRVECRTLSHLCGRLYLPMILFIVGLFTLIYITYILYIYCYETDKIRQKSHYTNWQTKGWQWLWLIGWIYQEGQDPVVHSYIYIYIASFKAIAIFCLQKLPTILRLSTDLLWPGVFWCS